ncbi:MAG: MFS transporter [Chloroflexi bacterium]|nr:MFS transporter [Chloroflexota bacterium]
MSTATSDQITTQRETVAPKVQAANFIHLYYDVAWYGLAFGSTLSFLAVFAARLGAAGWQVGLLSAGPALVNALVTLPAGRWLENQALGRAVVQTATWQRLGFFLMIPLPLLLPDSFKVWAVLLLTLLMAVPGTALAIGFNALLATTVPPEARGRVVGRRNALLAGMIMAAFLLSGWILDRLPFEWGYAAVFTLGALGGGMSTYHLSRIQVPPVPQFKNRPLQDRAQPGRGSGLGSDAPQRLDVTLRLWLRWRPVKGTWLAGISPQYWWVMLAYFCFHFTQLLPAALFPLFWVREVHLTDGEIGWVNALFYLTMLGVSPLLEPLTRRLGNYRLAVGGSILLASYPLITALSHGLALLLVVSVIGGTIWAILSGALVNRLLEMTPEDKRPSHLALYNLALNVATLISTMFGPFLADLLGLREALFIIAALRIGSGLVMARWG